VKLIVRTKACVTNDKTSRRIINGNYTSYLCNHINRTYNFKMLQYLTS
jgi:hypothetical protein